MKSRVKKMEDWSLGLLQILRLWRDIKYDPASCFRLHMLDTQTAKIFTELLKQNWRKNVNYGWTLS